MSYFVEILYEMKLMGLCFLAGEETREAISCVNEFNFFSKVQNMEAISSEHLRSYELNVLVFVRVDEKIRNSTE